MSVCVFILPWELNGSIDFDQRHLVRFLTSLSGLVYKSKVYKNSLSYLRGDKGETYYIVLF